MQELGSCVLTVRNEKGKIIDFIESKILHWRGRLNGY